MLILLIFIICSLLLGTIFIGPFSIRVYLTVVMLMLLLLNRNKLRLERIYAVPQSYLKLFVAYCFVMAFSLLACGEFMEYNYIKQFLAYFLVCIVAFLSMDYLIKSKHDIVKVVLLLSVLMNANAIVTIMQFQDSALGWAIGLVFGDISNDINFLSSHNDITLGVSRVPGIFGSTVISAFNLCIVAPLYFLLTDEKKSFYLRIYGFLSLILSFVAVFMTQQRASFGLLIIAILVVSWNKLIHNKIWLISIFLGLLIFSDNIIDYMTNFNLGRLSDSDNDNREFLWNKAISFILSNPIFGGPMRFQRDAGLSSHNIIFDSWIFAGLGGFIIMMVLYIKTIVSSCRGIIAGIKYNIEIIYSAMAVLVAMVYGLMHNTSYINGNVIIFIVLLLFLKSAEMSKIR